MKLAIARAVRKFAALIFRAPQAARLKPQASSLAPQPSSLPRGPRICVSLRVSADCTLAVVFHACQLDQALVECFMLALMHKTGDETRRLFCTLATNAAVQTARALPAIAPPPDWCVRTDPVLRERIGGNGLKIH